MLINKKHLNQYKYTPVEILVERMSSILGKYINKENGVSVFLSHKHNESEILNQVVKLLSDLGVTVYLDWLDDEMPSQTNGETAEKIKSRIIESNKFIFLATDGAISSKWCNWELGYGDAKKFEKHIAIMPIANDNGEWSGNEYLQIYPSITTEYQHSKGNY